MKLNFFILFISVTFFNSCYQIVPEGQSYWVIKYVCFRPIHRELNNMDNRQPVGNGQVFYQYELFIIKEKKNKTVKYTV